MTMTPSSVVKVMISSSMMVGFMSLDSFGVGVFVSAACAAKVQRSEVRKIENVFLSMSKNGPTCSVGQYRISDYGIVSLDHGKRQACRKFWNRNKTGYLSYFFVLHCNASGRKRGWVGRRGGRSS